MSRRTRAIFNLGIRNEVKGTPLYKYRGNLSSYSYVRESDNDLYGQITSTIKKNIKSNRRNQEGITIISDWLIGGGESRCLKTTAIGNSSGKVLEKDQYCNTHDYGNQLTQKNLEMQINTDTSLSSDTVSSYNIALLQQVLLETRCPDYIIKTKSDKLYKNLESEREKCFNDVMNKNYSSGNISQLTYCNQLPLQHTSEEAANSQSVLKAVAVSESINTYMCSKQPKDCEQSFPIVRATVLNCSDNNTMYSTNQLSDSAPEDLESLDNSLSDPDWIPDENSSEDDSFQENICSIKNSVQLNASPVSEIYPVISPVILKENDNSNIEHKSSFTQEHLEKTHTGKTEVGVEKAGRDNYSDRKDYCIYCEKDVSHFSRHLITWHASEFDVQRVLSLKNSSKERREALSHIRKKGNFIRNRSYERLRPVKRLNKNCLEIASADNFLPCKYCLGFYKKRSLYRHTKKCSANTDLQNSKTRQTSQSDGQMTLLLNSLFKHDQLLKTHLFPHMRADEIGLIAKRDPLICYYAYSYLKGRRSKGNLDLVRQNMRRLAKLLLFAQRRYDNIKELLDILRPCHFRIIIDGVNKIASYNNETDRYDSPTLAMNFGTLLKKCCDLAFIQLLQIDNTNQQREDVKILKTLIESQWSDEVSAQAATNLNQMKWNKDELLPLTTDLKILSEYLQNQAEVGYHQLKENVNDLLSYTTLKEVLYSQIILLNRRRPAEVAQLNVQTYKSINLNSQENNEFQNCLTETEKILLNTYSRFVIRGKRGRGVPILLSPKMKKHFDFLLSVRDNFVSQNNYVFHTSGAGFIDGTKILQKYVSKCDVKRPKSITATRLRKHLATITQLLQFSNNDMEQLSKFMGHTLKTHCSVYRMSDNIYQTAKVSKLLLLMMDKGVEQFKGKSLDEINIDLNPIYDDEDIFEKINTSLNYEQDADKEETIVRDNYLQTVDEKNSPTNNPNLVVNNNEHTSNDILSEKSSIREKVPRQSWSTEQKKVIVSFFKNHIKQKQPPKRLEVEKLVSCYPNLLKNRKWTSIKAVVYNIYTGKLKM